MAEFQLSKLVYILFLTSATTDLVVGYQNYVEHTLSEPDICNPLGKKRDTFSLSSEKNAAVIVKPTYMFDRWQPHCKFVFKAPKGEHLFAVIQNMYLRRNGDYCLDYIKFKRKDKHDTRQFCGQIDQRMGINRQKRSNWEPHSLESQSPLDFAEFDPEGEIETIIHLSNETLKPGEKLDLTIVYTPYKDCNRIKEDREDYRMTNYSGITVCLWKEYFCDGYQNCFPGICRDEDNCAIVSNGTGTKVTIGAVTTMLLCFIIFIMGLWICRRHKKMCWSSDCAGPSAHDNRLARAEREGVDPANPSVAVAPMLEVAVVPTVLDKDLPPSYDSLFPEQANPSTT